MNTLTDKEKKQLEKWIDSGVVYVIENNDEGCYQIAVREGKKKAPATDEVFEPQTVSYNSENDWEDYSE